mmetsp:Transcript_327/g.785  ORF Transcript_327/g.785 Transcript_327/m.785 type:complete len:211 (+) Transcript_327:2566-3198(+)
MPTWVHPVFVYGVRSRSGPPLSPKHASRPPVRTKPAHICVSVFRILLSSISSMTPVNCVALEKHTLLGTKGIATCCMDAVPRGMLESGSLSTSISCLNAVSPQPTAIVVEPSRGSRGSKFKSTRGNVVGVANRSNAMSKPCHSTAVKRGLQTISDTWMVSTPAVFGVFAVHRLYAPARTKKLNGFGVVSEKPATVFAVIVRLPVNARHMQ